MDVRDFCQENSVTVYLAYKRSLLVQVFEDLET